MAVIFPDWKTSGIKLPKGQRAGKTTCPRCSFGRKKQDDLCLSFDLDLGRADGFDGGGKCHHCQFDYMVRGDGARVERVADAIKPKREYQTPVYHPERFKLEKETLNYFKARGISRETLVANNIKTVGKVFTSERGVEPAIAFPFYKGGRLVNIQYRPESGDKEFRMVKGCEVCFYGIDDVIEDGQLATDTLIIVEGPIDKLSLYEVGYKYVWSVPNGSPFGDREEWSKDAALEFLNDADAQLILSRIKTVVLAGDNDVQGSRLIEELSKRLGVERCQKVSWPEGAKDANECLVKYGPEAVVKAVSEARPIPITGLISVSSVKDKLLNLYRTGITPGWSTGFANLEPHEVRSASRPTPFATIKEGYLHVLAGVPSAGKSRFVNNVLVNLARRYGIHSSLFVPESLPVEVHSARLIGVHAGLPFGKPTDVERIPLDKLYESAEWVDRHFQWLNPENRSIDEIFRLFDINRKQFGSRLLVIDPFNYVSYREVSDASDSALQTEQILAKIVTYARTYQVAILVIAHPKQQQIGKQTGEYPVISPYDLYGGSHWFNRSDFIFSLWRSVREPTMPIKLFVKKSKLEEVARTSHLPAEFTYNETTSLYTPYYGEDGFIPETSEAELEATGGEVRPARTYNRKGRKFSVLT